jgi:uncharacterized protein YdiU (UPF0061 family)
MNTDNMLVSGETIDYGPCAFMDAYNPKQVFSSIDQLGRYAYQNQPRIARFNLVCLARALVALLEADGEANLEAAQQVVDAFPEQHAAAYARVMAEKLGLSVPEPEDAALVQALLDAMQADGADFTLTFRYLSEVADPDAAAQSPALTLAGLFEPREALRAWLARFHARLARDPRSNAARAAAMRAANPALIPRNHKVEEALRAAEAEADFAPFHALVDALADPYTFDPAKAAYALPPRPEERVTRTFCGT